jgi:hypothetical protein
MSLETSNIQTFESKEQKDAYKTYEQIVKLFENGLNKEDFTTEEQINNLHQHGLKERYLIDNNVIKYLKDAGIIKPPVKVEIPKPIIKEPELYKTDVEKKSGLKIIEIDNETKQQFEHNKEVVDNLEEKKEILNETYEEIVESVGDFEYKTNFLKFLNLTKEYSQEKIDKDILDLENKINNREKNNDKSKKFSIVSERMIEKIIRKYNWFGKKIKIFPSFEFDDEMRGVDGILEFDNLEENNFLALQVDVTYSSKGYDDKILSLIHHNIKKNSPNKVKYFEKNGVPIPEFYSPKVIISYDIGDLKNLAYLDKKDDKDKIFNHKIKNSIFEQIVVQANFFKEYGLKVGSIEIANLYDKLLISIRNAINEIPEFVEKFDSILKKENYFKNEKVICLNKLVFKYNDIQKMNQFKQGA